MGTSVSPGTEAVTLLSTFSLACIVGYFAVKVGWCSLTVSEPVLKAPMVSAFEAEI
jgi:hypothetical protein